MSSVGFKVVFVCTGNTCRSPMAERAFHQLCERENVSSAIHASSAGLAAFPGDTVNPMAVQALADYDISADGFRSTAVSEYLLDEASLIVTMTESHRQQILSELPEYADKVRTLLSFTEGGDISDPIGGSLERYQDCLATMMPALSALLHDITSKI